MRNLTVSLLAVATFAATGVYAQSESLKTITERPTALAGNGALPRTLKHRLDSLNIPDSTISLVIQEIGAEAPLVSWNSEVPRNPASVMKMLTTFAALTELGPGFQWETEVKRTGLASDGVLKGDLVVVGNGNPMFVKHDLWSLVNQLESRGITTVAGDVVIDSSYFDLPEHDPAAFDGEAFRPYNTGPDASLFNFGALEFHLVPREGLRNVDIRVVPEIKGLSIVSKVRQTAKDCRGSNIKLRMETDSQPDEQRVTFNGYYPRNCGRYQLTRSVLSSPQLLYGTLATIIESRGGEVEGNLLLGEAPKSASKLFGMSSKTLSEVIRSTNKFSNNVMSQQLYLTLGAQKFGAPATQDKARRALLSVLASEGVTTDSIVVSNGSGLCRDCRITAASLMELLEAAWDSEYMPEFVASLGVPGVDGSLRKRFKKGSYRGRVHMKTGTIDHVSAAAGYVQTKSDKRYQFALMINHEGVHKGKGNALQRKLMSWMVQL